MKIISTPKLVLLLVLGLFLNGCATLDKNECLVANWETIGYEDGTKGRPASWIGKHRSACAKHNVAPDLTTYNKGRKQGLVQYCRADVGYREGVNGRKYQNVCPRASERKFLSGYDYGRRIYKVKSRIRSLGYKIRKEEKVLDELADNVTVTEAELIRSGVSRSRRAILLDKLKHLSRDMHDSEALIANLSDQVVEAKQELFQLQERNPYEI
jgi:uncharacterized coiled-coil protein SlyX